MATQSRSPAEHYAEAQRLLDDMPPIDEASMQHVVYVVGAAITHALLATVAPGKPGRRRYGRRSYDSPASSPAERWLTGQDDEGGEPSR